jgi:hypothetical protein
LILYERGSEQSELYVARSILKQLERLIASLESKDRFRIEVAHLDLVLDQAIKRNVLNWPVEQVGNSLDSFWISLDNSLGGPTVVRIVVADDQRAYAIYVPVQKLDRYSRSLTGASIDYNGTALAQQDNVTGPLADIQEKQLSRQANTPPYSFVQSRRERGRSSVVGKEASSESRSEAPSVQISRMG